MKESDRHAYGMLECVCVCDAISCDCPCSLITRPTDFELWLKVHVCMHALK